MTEEGESARAEQKEALPRWLLSIAGPAFAAVLLLYLLYEFLLSHVEGDQAYLLYAAQQVLNGVQLDGPRLIETNPPLIVWFSEIPALLGRVLHIDAVLALRLVVLAMLAASAAWGWRVLRVAGVARHLGSKTAGVLWAATFTLVTVSQPAEFGQREQLLLALLLPYLLAVGMDMVGELQLPERLALGICAGLAVCFKPQHLLTLVCVQLFLLLCSRSARFLISIEIAAAAGVGLLYVWAVNVFTPAYFGVIVPLLRSTYWALGKYTFAQMLLRVGVGLTVSCLFAIVAWWLLRTRLVVPRLVGVVFAGSVGATLAYFQQHTGWYHQRFPANVLLLVGAVWMIAGLLHGSTGPKNSASSSSARAAWLVLPASAVLLFVLVYVHRHAATEAPNLQSELRRVSAGSTVYVFSVGMNAFPMVVERHLVWGSRFAHLWMLPSIRANELPVPGSGYAFQALSPERLHELASLQRKETTEDLLRTRPAVIFVDRCSEHLCESYTSPFDAIQWFSQDADFAHFWADYCREKQLPDYDVYRRAEHC